MLPRTSVPGRSIPNRFLLKRGHRPDRPDQAACRPEKAAAGDNQIVKAHIATVVPYIPRFQGSPQIQGEIEQSLLRTDVPVIDQSARCKILAGSLIALESGQVERAAEGEKILSRADSIKGKPCLAANQNRIAVPCTGGRELGGNPVKIFLATKRLGGATKLRLSLGPGFWEFELIEGVIIKTGKEVADAKIIVL